MSKIDSGQKKVVFMALILTVVAMLIQAGLLSIFYYKDITHHKQHLQDIVKSQMRLFESIVKYDKEMSEMIEDEIPKYDHDVASLNQILEAHKNFNGFGENGEFTIARLVDSNIVFLSTQRDKKEIIIPLNSEFAEPMRLALQGKSGVVRGKDYKGVEVLAAYQYIESMGLGLVAKVNMNELREPFINAGIIGLFLSVILVAFGAKSIFNIATPLVVSLKKSNERFRKAFDQAGDALFMTDNEGRFIDVNLMACNSTGYSREELLNMNLFEIDTLTSKEDFADMLNSMSNGDHLTYESMQRHKEGFEFPVEVNAGLFERDGQNFVLSIVRDITKRIASDKALRSNEEKLRTIYSSMNEGMALHEIIYNENKKAINYRIIEINPSYESILGLKRKDVVGELASKAYQTDVPPYLDIYHEVVLTGIPQSFETHFEPLDKHFNISVFRTSDAKFATVFSDITENKKLNELKSRAERLESAGQIAGQVAHDFNNLLAPLLGYPEVIRDELPENHPALKYLQSIEQSAIKIAEINQQLLTLGRRGHYTQDVINLNDIISQVLRDMGQLPEKIVCKTNLDNNLLNIKGGGAQLYRVLNNMITNSCDAIGDAGEISITTENYYIDNDKKSFIHIPKGEYVKLRIKDNGGGILPEIQQTIFDPFFTTKKTDKKRGSGLGLSVVDSVIKDHGGYIDLVSEIGVGTEFFLYFPICREEINNNLEDAPKTGNEKILLVDDDDIQMDVSTRMLKKLGYQVEIARSGIEAVGKTKDNKFDLIVLDMIMPPGIDGAETYRRILEFHPKQKAIIVSGYSESERVLLAQKLGAGEFVRKPISFNIIARAVRTELDREAVAVS